jgi:hypothetical protein
MAARQRANTTNRGRNTASRLVQSAGEPAVASVEAQNNEWLTDVMVGRRVVDDTRRNYTLAFKFLSEHCKTSIPNSCDSNGQLILPLTPAIWLKLLNDMAEPIDATGKIRAYGTLQSYISAIKFFYEERGVTLPTEMKRNIVCWMDGYKRKIVELRGIGVMKNKEGKLPLSNLQYSRLCELSLFAVVTRAVSSAFVHVFMILCWNLFARSCSVSDLYFHHLSWETDALVIDMSKHKADQTGERITPKHVYANPYQPAVCPILALALHVFSNAFRVDGVNKDKIFLSTGSYDIFCKWFALALRALSNLGFQPEDFGTHSFRKGITSFVSGFIGGPGIISIFLRAGWSCGAVQDRYLTYSDGGDQFCGRIACGLSFNDGCKFSVLPPSFSNPQIIISEAEWDEILPGYRGYPASFRGCLPYLLASIAFHRDWLYEKNSSGNMKNISEQHPFFRSRLATAAKRGEGQEGGGSSSLLLWLQGQVLPLNTDGHCLHTGITATGIPPHIDQARQIEKLRQENEKLRAIIEKHHTEVMNELPQRVTSIFRETITAPGLQQMSAPELKVLLRELFSVERAVWDNHNAAAQLSQQQQIGRSNPLEDGTLVRDGFTMWMWRGRYRNIPPNYRFPGGTTKEVCDFFMHFSLGQSI